MNAKRFFLKLLNIVFALLIFAGLLSLGFFMAGMIVFIFDPEVKSIPFMIISFLFFFFLALFFWIRIIGNMNKKQALKTKEKENNAEIISSDCVEPMPESYAESEPAPAPEPEPEPEPNPEIITPPEYYSDPLFPEAVQVIIESNTVSAGRLQAALKIGSKRAVRMITEMEELGIIGPQVGNLHREIFFTEDEWKTTKNKFKWYPKESDEGSYRSLNHVSARSNNSGVCTCIRCGSKHISYTTVVEKEDFGGFLQFLLLILMIIMFGILIGFFVGMITIGIFLILARPKTITYAVCQDCGNRWQTS